MNKKIFLCLLLFCLFNYSCIDKHKKFNVSNDTEIINKYKTEIRVHYSAYEKPYYIFITDNETDICSFNGTNYLIEKGKQEEIFSTTAPIEITGQFKIDEYGKKYEVTRYTKEY